MKKIGRPTDCLKDIDLKVRVDSKTNSKIISYAHENNITKAEVVRIAIKEFFGRKQKKGICAKFGDLTDTCPLLGTYIIQQVPRLIKP